MVLPLARSAILHNYPHWKTMGNTKLSVTYKQNALFTISGIYFSVTPYYIFCRKIWLIFDCKKLTLHPLDRIQADFPTVASFYVISVNIAGKWNWFLLGKLHIRQRGLFQSDIPDVDDKAYIGMFTVLVDIYN
jgi:hypothetical protein